MGKITPAKPVKLIVGLIFKDDKSFHKTKGILIRKFKEVDFESESIPFDFTDYYQDELGNGLTRKFLSFKKLIHPSDIARIKVFTNKIENKLAFHGKRRINIDPGYLDLARLILASTKDFAHRIYLGKGIFGELTLIYRGHSYKSWEWTYPDYRREDYISIFNKIRENYAHESKE
jgi:hypothetical protein